MKIAEGLDKSAGDSPQVNLWTITPTMASNKREIEIFGKSVDVLLSFHSESEDIKSQNVSLYLA